MSKAKMKQQGGFEIAGGEEIFNQYAEGSNDVVEPQKLEQYLSTSSTLPVQKISISEIKRWKKQPRKYFDPEALNLLAKSFNEDGFLGTLLVRPDSNGNGYLIVFGERRWRAAKIAGLKEVLCVVRDFDDSAALNLAMGENMLREDLSKLEETEGVLAVIESELKISQDDVAKLINTHVKSRYMEKGSYVGTHEEARELLPKIKKTLERYGISLSSFKSKNLQVRNLPESLKKEHLENNLDYSKALELKKLPEEELEKALSIINSGTNDKLKSLNDVKAFVKGCLAEIKKAPTSVDDRTQFRTITKQIGSAQQWKKINADTAKSRKLKRLLSQLESLLNE